jgi:phage terminase small subunit
LTKSKRSSKPSGQPLSAQQQRFIAEYLIDQKPKAAAVRAGYAESSAHITASKLLANPRVWPEIEKGLAEQRQKITSYTEITVERVVAELAKIGFANIGSFITVDADGDPRTTFKNIGPDQFAAVSEITTDRIISGPAEDKQEVKRVRVKLHDKRAALVDLGKYLGIFDRDRNSDDANTVVVSGGLPDDEK